MNNFSPGISIILPSFEGVKYLPRVLTSLHEQTLDHKLIEILVVLNGPEDGSREVVRRFQKAHSELALKILESSIAGASRARNIGLSSVTREFVTFVDVDDELESGFLQTAFSLVDESTCALMPIVDIKQGESEPANSLNTRIASYAGQKNLMRSMAWCLGFNACKILPTWTVQKYRYKEELKSGEDVAFFANLLKIPDLGVAVPQTQGGISYLRHVRTASVSRQLISFEFNVVQRLQCISSIRSVDVDSVALHARESLVNAQFLFIQDYLKKHPAHVDNAIKIAKEFGLSGLDFASLRREKARRLVISYCFPPYSDTSANVVAKQIAEDEILVDVISANMARVRNIDASTSLIAPEYIVQHIEEKVEPSFASWPLISSFARKSLKSATLLQLQGHLYETMYSRALWSGSHVAAALVKHRFPKIHWEAEFSDPMRRGVDGASRNGKITWGRTTNRLRGIIENNGWSILEIDSHFALTEAVTFILANELYFTNEYQRAVMLEDYPSDFQHMVLDKSTIRPHARPKEDLFRIGQPEYELDSAKINIGYFGNFYENRGIGPVLTAIERLPDELRNKFALHVFCSNPSEVRTLMKTRSLQSTVLAHSYLSYIDYLAILNRFNVLLVTDVDIEASAYEVNPFLPSKHSDYLASKTPIWGIVSTGSALDQSSVSFKSIQTESDSITQELYRMLEVLG